MLDLIARPVRRRPRSVAPTVAARLSAVELPELDFTRSPWPGRTVQVGGAEVFVRAIPGGEGAESALYVHGLGGASTNWTDIAALMAPWLDGEAIDLSGFGRSGPAPDSDYSIAAHARTVIGYLEQSGRGPVHLVGNSMGGAISIYVAARRPDLVRTLTLISPAVPDVRPKRLGHDPLLPLVAVPGIGQLVVRRMDRMSPERRAKAVIELCFADPSRIPPERLAEAAEEIRARRGQRFAGDAFVRSLRGLIGSYLFTGARSMWAQLAAITAPTLVVWGDRDRLVDVGLAPRVAHTVPEGRLLVLTGVGHVAQMEQPVTTAQALVALLEDARAGSV